MTILNKEELDMFHNWRELDGGQFITAISAKTGYPYTTPVNFVLYNSKFYTSVHKKAAKIRFVQEGSTKFCITFYINGTARKPYFGLTGDTRLLGTSVDQSIIKQTQQFMEEIEHREVSEHSTLGVISQLKQWLNNPDRLLLEFTPRSVYGKTRGAI